MVLRDGTASREIKKKTGVVSTELCAAQCRNIKPQSTAARHPDPKHTKAAQKYRERVHGRRAERLSFLKQIL